MHLLRRRSQGSGNDRLPGGPCYLLAGPNWNGEVPQGIAQVFQAKTRTAFVVPRVFMDYSAEDREAVQGAIAAIDVHPLAQFDGKMKTHDWRKLPALKSPTGDDGAAETKWVFPDKFFDELPAVLVDAPSLPGEEARCAAIRSVLDAAKRDPALKAAMIDEAAKTETDLIEPLLQPLRRGPVKPLYPLESGGYFG